MAWRYENPGYRELLVMPGHTVKCDSTKSKTGYAFWQSYQYKSFDIPDATEIWVKFDVYSASGTSNKWCAYNGGSGQYNGITRYVDQINIWTSSNTSDSTVTYDTTDWTGLHTIILHMIADASDGTVEFWLDGTKAASATGKNVNSGNPFSDFYLESDGSDVLFSNVIISNAELTNDDTCDLSKTPWIQPVIGKDGIFGTDNFAVRRSDSTTTIYKIFDSIDTYYGIRDYIDFYIKEDISIKTVCLCFVDNNNRQNIKTFTLSSSDDGTTFSAIKSVQKSASNPYCLIDITDYQSYHYYRITVDSFIAVDGVVINAITNTAKEINVLIDTSRNISSAIVVSNDTARNVNDTVNESQDTARTLIVSSISNADTSRTLSAIAFVSVDTVRYVSCDTVIHADTVRALAENIDVDIAADTTRNLYRAVSMLDDTTRKISNVESVNADIKRIVSADAIDMLDTVRTLTHTAGLTADTVRAVAKSIVIDADTARITNSSTITLHADTSRQLANDTAVSVDTMRDVSLTLALSIDLSRDTGKTSFDADVVRNLYKIVSVPVDTVRRIPHDLFGTKEPVFENQDTFTPFPKNVTKGAEKGIIDFKLVLEENTLSDKISADVIGYEYWPGDIIKGTFIDYPYEMKIESTQNTGVRQTINAMHYKDRLLYTGMHYDGYHLYELNKNRKASYRYMLRAQWYVNRIKESLSLHVDSRFSNFTPESNFSDTDMTYADFLSGLFGWTSQYPWRLVNVFLRGTTLYILQRGRENSVYDITNLPHTEPTIERSIYYSPYASNNRNNTYTSSRTKVPHDPMLDVKDPDEPDEPDDSEYKDPNDNDTDRNEELRFNGVIYGDHIKQTYSGGLCVEEVHYIDELGPDGTTYQKVNVVVTRDYDGDDRCTRERSDNADGTWRETNTSYTYGGVGSYSHTEDGDEYGVTQKTDVYTAFLGGSFTGTSTYVDGQFVSSSISGSGIINRTLPYTQNQQNAGLQQAADNQNKDDEDEQRQQNLANAKTDPYIPTVDHSIRKQIQKEIDSYDRSIQETVSLDIIMPVIAGKPTMKHIIDFTERIKFNGAEYYLMRNTVEQTVTSLKQSIEITRWIRR